MAVRASTAPTHGKRPEPLITVLVNDERFAGPTCQLANNMTVTPGTVAGLLLDDAWIERIVFGPHARPIDVGHRRRIFTGATRRAVQVAGQEAPGRPRDPPPSPTATTTASSTENAAPGDTGS